MTIKEEEVQTKGTENIFHIIVAGNFPNIRKEMDIPDQEVFRTLKRQYQKRNHSKSYYSYIIVKTLSMY
jgi:hypothetical protein